MKKRRNARRSLQFDARKHPITTFLLGMAPAVMQGYWVFNTRKPSGGGVSSGVIDNYLVDTCWVWRKGGPLESRLKEKER